MANGSFHMHRAAVDKKYTDAGIRDASSTEKAKLRGLGASSKEVRPALFAEKEKRASRRKALKKMTPLIGGRFAGANIGLQGSEG
jgi:hypothetical protein